MKKSIIYIAFSIFNLVNVNLDSNLFTNADIIESTIVDEQVILTAGTVVSLKTIEDISLEEVSVGNTIDFFVRNDVVVDGNVVIATGTIGEGRIKKISRSCNGRCTKLTITAETVQTVDGQRIYLRSIPFSKKFHDNNWGYEKTIIPAKTNLSARVLNDVKIEA